MFFFFFSSRRRHTRLTCDWSSDVCSSDLGKFCGQRRPCGAIEDPDRTETMAPQQRGEPDQIKATAQLRSAMLKIERFGDRRFRGKKLLGMARRRGKKSYPAARRNAGDGAD